MGSCGRLAGATIVMVIALALSLPCLVVRGDRADAEAATLYEKGVKAIRSGNYKEGIRLMEAALARGATEPNDQQGDSRFPVTRYDPYYWLGIAYMGLGDDEKALINFQKSKDYGAIKAWKTEWKDLNARLEVVRRRLESATTRPSPALPPVSISSPTTLAAAVPSAPSPTFATSATAAAVYARPLSTPTLSTVTAASPVAAELGRLGSELDRWLTTTVLDEATRRQLTSRREAVRIALSDRSLSAQALSKLAAGETKLYVDRLLPALRQVTLAAALAALQRKDWETCDTALAAARRTGASPETDILDLVRHATRYILSERRDRAELAAAREALRSWREKVGSNRSLPLFVSPAIQALLPEGQNR